MMDRLQSLDMANPEALQELLAGGGEGLLGPPSAALQAATGRLEVLLALTAGYALVIAGRALKAGLGLAAIEAAAGRRDADRSPPPACSPCCCGPMPTAPPPPASASAARSWAPPTSRAWTGSGRARSTCPPPRSWTCPAAGWSGSA